MPSGGGRYYSLNLRDEPTAITIERYAKSENIRREQVVKAAMKLFEQYTKVSDSSETGQGIFGKVTPTSKLDTQVWAMKEC